MTHDHNTQTCWLKVCRIWAQHTEIAVPHYSSSCHISIQVSGKGGVMMDMAFSHKKNNYVLHLIRQGGAFSDSAFPPTYH